MTGEVVGFGAAAYRHWIEIVNDIVSLLDDLDREVSLVVDVPTELVTSLDVETVPEKRQGS